ncbi:MAG: DNA-binding transcriptional LysR family regulator [Candidatus Azotimanducaceae bacterium]|jgi:DNA-binding transcriptional LysR family regulator
MSAPISWEDAQTFLAVVESGSFSAAARVLDLGQPTISRRIKNLEQRLSQQLFVRGKHGATRTTAADRLLPAAEQMAKWAAEFDHATRGAEDLVAGIVKIAAPPGVAVEQLAPLAAALAAQLPDIQLEILSSVDHVDLTRGTADIAIRTQFPNEPELIALHEFQSQPAVYGAPAYVAKLKVPCDWQDLDWVTWAGKYRDIAPRPMLQKLIPQFQPILASDDYLVQKAAVKAGIGVMICSPSGPFDTDALMAVDIGVTLPISPFYIVCARSMQHVPRVKRVVELMVENLI